MLLIIIIRIAFACGIVKNNTIRIERLAMGSPCKWISSHADRTSEGWNPPQIPGGLTHQGIFGRYPKGILEGSKS